MADIIERIVGTLCRTILLHFGLMILETPNDFNEIKKIPNRSKNNIWGNLKILELQNNSKVSKRWGPNNLEDPSDIFWKILTI